MNKTIYINLFKLFTIFFWILVVVHIFSPISGASTKLILMSGGAIFLLHVFEVAVFWSKYKIYSKKPLVDALQILVFGVVHLKKFAELAEEDQR